MDILWQQSSRNYINQQEAMEPNKLDQETKIISYKSHQIQWPTLQQIRWSVASASLVI